METPDNTVPQRRTTLGILETDFGAPAEDLLRIFDENPLGFTALMLTALDKPWSDWVDRTQTEVPAAGAHFSFGERRAPESLAGLKKHLLYFEKMYITDPLERSLYPSLLHAHLLGTITEDQASLQGIRSGLSDLVALKNFESAGAVIAVPFSHLGLSRYVQTPASAHVKTLPPIADDSLRIERDEALVNWLIAEQLDAEVLVDRAETQPAVEALFRTGPTSQSQIVAECHERFAVPNVDGLPIETVLAIRKNSSVFGDWRRTYGDLVQEAYTFSEGNEAHFEREFRKGLKERLDPLVERLEREAKSPALTDLVSGTSSSIGLGVVAYLVGIGEPVAGAMAGAGTALSWVSRRVGRTFSRRNRAAKALRACITSLATTAKKV